MSLWLFRAGSNGEYEQKFLDDNRVYLTWDDLNIDFSPFPDKLSLQKHLIENYFNDEDKPGLIRNNMSQFWAMFRKMQIGDWIVLPSKKRSSIHFGKITSNYTFDSSLGSPYYHYREVDWFATDIPRSTFDQDILYSMGAFITICRIQRNDAENRIKAIAATNWQTKPTPLSNTQVLNEADDEQLQGSFDIELASYDQISTYLIRKFKGHGMERLIQAILEAQGYTTYLSPEGPDHGIDILAASGPLGFQSPKICVQVKTSNTPVDRPTLDQLVGSMHNFGADQGILVSWSGFKTSVEKEVPKQFFKVRLWDAKSVISELFKVYDRLNEEIRTEIPLKRVWVLTELTSM